MHRSADKPQGKRPSRTAGCRRRFAKPDCKLELMHVTAFTFYTSDFTDVGYKYVTFKSARLEVVRRRRSVLPEAINGPLAEKAVPSRYVVAGATRRESVRSVF